MAHVVDALLCNGKTHVEWFIGFWCVLCDYCVFLCCPGWTRCALHNAQERIVFYLACLMQTMVVIYWHLFRVHFAAWVDLTNPEKIFIK